MYCQVELYTTDEYVHSGVTASWGSAFLKSIDTVKSRLNEISLPLLIIHGSDDGLVPIVASENLHNDCSSEDKTFEVSFAHRQRILVLNLSIISICQS